MKLQEVILRAIARKITWADAADIAGVSPRAMSYLRRRYEQFGYDGLYEQRRRRRFIHRVPLLTVERALTLYQLKYPGLDPRRFHQKLRKEHAITVSYGWLKQALQGAGLERREAPEGLH